MELLEPPLSLLGDVFGVLDAGLDGFFNGFSVAPKIGFYMISVIGQPVLFFLIARRVLPRGLGPELGAVGLRSLMTWLLKNTPAWLEPSGLLSGGFSVYCPSLCGKSVGKKKSKKNTTHIC